MVRIITDSASDFEPQEFEALKVDYASLYVYFGDEEYKENVRKIKVLKLRKGGAEKAITRWKADLI